MAWLAVNKNGDEKIFEERPERYLPLNTWVSNPSQVSLVEGTILKILGKKLTWKNKPVKI